MLCFPRACACACVDVITYVRVQIGLLYMHVYVNLVVPSHASFLLGTELKKENLIKYLLLPCWRNNA